MPPLRSRLHVYRAVVIVLGLMVPLVMATRGAAQETVHHMLEQLSLGNRRRPRRPRFSSRSSPIFSVPPAGNLPVTRCLA